MFSRSLLPVLMSSPEDWGGVGSGRGGWGRGWVGVCWKKFTNFVSCLRVKMCRLHIPWELPNLHMWNSIFCKSIFEHKIVIWHRLYFWFFSPLWLSVIWAKPGSNFAAVRSPLLPIAHFQCPFLSIFAHCPHQHLKKLSEEPLFSRLMRCGDRDPGKNLS